MLQTISPPSQIWFICMGVDVVFLLFVWVAYRLGGRYLYRGAALSAAFGATWWIIAEMIRAQDVHSHWATLAALVLIIGTKWASRMSSIPLPIVAAVLTLTMIWQLADEHHRFTWWAGSTLFFAVVMMVAITLGSIAQASLNQHLLRREQQAPNVA